MTLTAGAPAIAAGGLGAAFWRMWTASVVSRFGDALRCVLVAALAVAIATGNASVWLLVVFAFALSTVGTLFDSSSFAILPELVPADRLAKANGRMQIGGTISGGLLGAPVAGGLFVLAASLPFAVDAVTIALAALLALTLPRMPAAEAEPAPRVSLWDAAVAGVRWMWREPVDVA